MTILHGNSEDALKLLEAFGIHRGEKVRKVVITIEYNDTVTIEVTRLVENINEDKIEEVLSKYHLHEYIENTDKEEIDISTVD